MPDEVDASLRGLYPRWPLLAAIIWAPILAVMYLLQQYDPVLYCRSQYICMVYQWPTLVHVVLAILIYLLIWQLAQMFGMRPLETTSRYSEFGDWVRDLSEWHSARLPMIALAIVSLLSLVAAFLLGIDLDPLVMVTLGIIIFVAFLMLAYREPALTSIAADGGDQAATGAEEAEAQRIRRTDSPSYLFFTAWPWRVFTLIPPVRRRVFGPDAPAPAAVTQMQTPPPAAPPDPGQQPGRFVPPVN